MCLETGAIPRSKRPEYKMTLSVYPVSRCGGDLQKGEPIEVMRAGSDVSILKNGVEEVLLSVLPEDCSGMCFVEMLITLNNGYHDRDEWWCEVDLSAKTVTYRGGYA